MKLGLSMEILFILIQYSINHCFIPFLNHFPFWLFWFHNLLIQSPDPLQDHQFALHRRLQLPCPFQQTLPLPGIRVKSLILVLLSRENQLDYINMGISKLGSYIANLTLLYIIITVHLNVTLLILILTSILSGYDIWDSLSVCSVFNKYINTLIFNNQTLEEHRRESKYPSNKSVNSCI